MISSLEELNNILSSGENDVFQMWLEEINTNKVVKKGLFSERDIIDISSKLYRTFLKLRDYDFNNGLVEITTSSGKESLEEFSKIMAIKNQTPTATSMYIYSLKSVMYKFLQKQIEDSSLLNKEILRTSEVIDKMGLYTFNYFVKERESIIQMQQQDMMELSTPVIKVWENVLAIPLIGTLDSKRTQMIMEKLLDMIVTTSSKVAIIDITGVPTVDTLVANHLIKTVAATRLLGAEIIITGISPVIAQTMVHLGIDLSEVITKAVMEDGIKTALEICDFKILKLK
ncbi:STAS domain-containing protein [Clostridium cylindrosporum]|uniref:RsbT co-antagonist protein RsbRA n=1 Tax=Clostridium cylindrosporum DSM 605 TaxID=1121307 RepID=A0A0J8D7Z4_CLOCY|nr:STAS domain-containing protein [Clostridium cylindrosporum]KMT21997.1 RsbT co-antagonist protein RsbRA [Clostridium cylindrosporum DSM 605]